ncbi:MULTISPECIES: phosphatidylglycerophosphatase A family protein [Thalassospira]|uniref:phosphatidylglycerophosphatase A family protein n=1 Tax=Thalassospira TaxID=168934 RepID=UPI0003B54338|nr:MULTISPECIES: phosphatidylglycerophosphatase A [Thalassospira]RCK26304.1 phosphatidylglycerophosphatase [Thalassospira lucentensis MCCC 1A00383 = DSM 14000]|tara:strand:+ start:827 stop:1318 length:492 start_codon:yes stop_codon:yes gene_type:complete
MPFSRFLITCSATWFYSGKSPKAPGTMGSFAALPFGWLLWAYGGNTALIVASIVVFVFGVFIADRYSHMIGVHDAGEIVIDEVVGQWMCLMVIPLGNGWIDLAWLFGAFVAFRVFDVLKPWPIRWVDRRVGGGFGIMCDDVLAGIFAMIILAGIHHFISGGFV